MRKPVRAKPEVKTYFVNDPNVSSTLGGVQVLEEDGKRLVRMTEGQAGYYVTQGTISEKELTGDQKAFAAQVHGVKVDPKVNEESNDAIKAAANRARSPSAPVKDRPLNSPARPDRPVKGPSGE